MSYRVRTDSFEGPFDLLLYLVSRQKVDIGAINITQIADQYLAEVGRMQNLDLDVASDFLLVASTLLEIKAQSLLPREHIEVEDDIAELAPSEVEELSALGAGCAAMLALGWTDEAGLSHRRHLPCFRPTMEPARRERCYEGWKRAVRTLL